MIRIEYIFLDPTRNYTLLAETPVPPAKQPLVASRLMEAEPLAEQAGFISPGKDRCDISLRMAGGEFCGNAAMSAAAVFADGAGMGAGTVSVRVSGATEPVSVDVSPMTDGARRCTVDMPRPVSVTTERLPGYGMLPVVRFDGIAHVIMRHPLPRARAEMLASAWCGHLGCEALGLMFLDADASELTPLVYVPAADTMFWENSCASGTAAVGAYLAEMRGETVTARLRQPGGTLGITASPEGDLKLTGAVKILRRASADVDLDDCGV